MHNYLPYKMYVMWEALFCLRETVVYIFSYILYVNSHSSNYDLINGDHILGCFICIIPLVHWVLKHLLSLCGLGLQSLSKEICSQNPFPLFKGHQ